MVSDGTTLWFVDISYDVSRAYVASTRASDADKDIVLGTGSCQGGVSGWHHECWFVDSTDDDARAYVAIYQSQGSPIRTLFLAPELGRVAVSN